MQPAAGPCFQRLTVLGQVTGREVHQVVQLLDLLPGTQHLQELELEQGWYDTTQWATV
jgi:hypothetical protein